VSGIKGLRSPIVIAAFEGWSDAGEAATGVTHHLGLTLDTQPVAAINPDDYYDFQVTRPVTEGDYLTDLHIIWPTTRLSAGTIPGTDIDLMLVHGIEPNMRWQAFTEELMKLVRPVSPRAVITLAALLADNPHTRPVPVTATVNNPRSAARYDIEHSSAPGTGGAAGITTVFAKAVAESGLECILLWGSVPHYAAEPPSPKVTLALLREIQNLLALAIPLGDLPEAARNWERSVDELAAQDVEIMEYVRSLESAL